MLKTALRDAIPRRAQVPIKYWYGVARRHHEPEMALIPYLVIKGDHALDVGGNRGTYAYDLYRLGARLDVFEPHPSCATVLSAWAESKSRVCVHSVALSDTAGIANLHVPVDSRGVAHDASASIEDRAEGEFKDISVELRTLDSFRFRDVGFIKIDTEGHEGAVLAGAQETIRAGRPSLLIEIEQRHLGSEPIAAVFDRIKSWGYRGYFMQGSRLKKIQDFDVERDQSIIAFENGGTYLNNFLFLSTADLGKDRYGRLALRWMDAGVMFG